MTRHEALHKYFYDMLGIHLSENEIKEIIDISHKTDTSEDNVPDRYLDDCILIRNTLREAGYDIGLRNALSLWSSHSDDMAAGWLGLPYDENDQLDKEAIILILNRWDILDREYFRI